MIYIGIDPGKDGAMAELLCGPRGDLLDVRTTPFDELRYRDRLEEVSKCMGGVACCLEAVHAMPKQGVNSTFSFGSNFGLIRGMLILARIPFQEVAPRLWKAAFSLNSDKRKSIDVCKHLFPCVDLRRTEKCRKEHDGIAEALLMAEYARRKMGH